MFSSEMFVNFQAQTEVQGGQGVELMARNFYSLRVCGFLNQRASALAASTSSCPNKLVLSVVVIERHLLREDFDPTLLLSHGSRTVLVSGQPHKVFCAPELLTFAANEKREGREEEGSGGEEVAVID